MRKNTNVSHGTMLIYKKTIIEYYTDVSLKQINFLNEDTQKKWYSHVPKVRGVDFKTPLLQIKIISLLTNSLSNNL